MDDTKYMQLALELAAKGTGKVNPNPLVGAVIVKDGKIIGEGYHEKYGELHAERNALANCSSSPKSATMYVTLEPCCHYGKTPPCTEAIIENRIAKVVVGTLDPNEKMAGKGVEILRNAGIEVLVGVLEEECKRINEVFFHYITTKRPYVVMKYAMTMDGKIATVTGKSKWITGEIARRNVHKDRNKYFAIMVGTGTVISDDPMLTCRIDDGRNPIRIICDSRLTTSLESHIVKTANEVRTIIATICGDEAKHKPYIQKGCEIVAVSEVKGHIDLSELMTKLGEMKIDNILLEGGSTLNFSALDAGIVNKIQCYIAPKIFGGVSAKTPVGGSGIKEVYDAVKVKNSKVVILENDIMIESEVENNVHRNS